MLSRDEVQPRCLNVEVKGESLVLRTACSPWLVEQLETDRGLRVFSRLPEREHQRLLDIARRPHRVGGCMSIFDVVGASVVEMMRWAFMAAVWGTVWPEALCDSAGQPETRGRRRAAIKAPIGIKLRDGEAMETRRRPRWATIKALPAPPHRPRPYGC